ncbi:hypothetical protein BASA81_014538 [Batrachochytrium salamandrivorans]|nr:hypothetical protein BASA81_014538 [Batrachochytrium salamandrivorans]
MLQKNATPKKIQKANPLPVVPSLTVFVRMVKFSGEEGRETSSDITLASVAGSVRMRSTDSDRSVRATPKKARDASPPPQDDLWVVVKNLSQQVAAQQAEWMLCATLLLSSKRQQPTWRKSLAIWQVRQRQPTVATKPNPTTTTATATTTTTTTTDQPSKNTRFADAVKKQPTHQQLVERQPDFRKAGAAAWLALKRETSVPAHSAPKVELSSGLRLIYASGFPMQSLVIFERPCREPASVPVQYEIFAGYPVRTITIYHILDIRPCSRLDHLPPLHSRSNPGSPDGACLQDRSPYHKTRCRFRITVPEDRQRNIIQRLERQSKQTHWRIRQNYRHRRPDQPRPTAPPPPLSRQILAVNVANISNKRPAIRHIVRNTRLWAISETCITSSKFRFTVPGFDVIQHPATGPGRRGIALGIPSCFGGHEHGSAVGTMILAKVPNFTPESPSAHCPLVGSWLDCHAVSGSQITRLSTVHGRRHSSIDHFVCNAPARALLTSPRVDRQTAVVDHFVIRTSIRAEAQGQPPAPRAPIISRHHCLEATDQIATSNYWDVLADGATDDTDTDTDIHQLTSQFLESANAVADNLSFDSHHQPLDPIAGFYLVPLTCHIGKQHCTASIHFRCNHRNPDPVPCNTLRDEWSRLKAAATQLERVDGRNNGSSTRTILIVLYQTAGPISYLCCTCHVWKQFRSAAVTPLYNSNGIVQYDPTSILRVMQVTMDH